MHPNRRLLKGVGHFGAKYTVERLCIPPTSIHRYIEEWFYYNFAPGSFHTKNFVAHVIRLNLNFIHKNDKFAF